MRSMTTFRPGDLLLVAFPFADGTQAKTRPALVLLDTGDADVVLARVGTRPPHVPHDVVLANWQEVGLLAPSVVRLHKIITLEKLKVVRALGTLQPADRRSVAAVLIQTFGN